MIETKKEVRGMVISSKKTYIPEPIVGKSALKKNEIVTGILSEGSQLSLLATLVEQLGIQVGLSTPEFIYAQTEFAKIKAVLAKV